MFRISCMSELNSGNEIIMEEMSVDRFVIKPSLDLCG